MPVGSEVRLLRWEKMVVTEPCHPPPLQHWESSQQTASSSPVFVPPTDTERGWPWKARHCSPRPEEAVSAQSSSRDWLRLGRPASCFRPLPSPGVGQE